MRKLFSKIILVVLIIALPVTVFANGREEIVGAWVINEELSDDTDKQVERAVKDAGGKIRSKKKGKGRHRGGPEEQELYDRISYDEVLTIQYTEPEFRFIYADEFERVFYRARCR